jgi:dethiobiotin synthetase
MFSSDRIRESVLMGCGKGEKPPDFKKSELAVGKVENRSQLAPILDWQFGPDKWIDLTGQPTEELKMAAGIYIAGTDTDVGKTAVAMAVLRQLVTAGNDCRAYKPVASGVLPGHSDPEQLWQAAGCPGLLAEVCPQVFQAAIAPEQAARAEGRRVDERLLRQGIVPHLASDLIVVEGAGGLFSPLGPGILNADLAHDFGLPVVVVDAARLGLIGRTLATVTAARAVGLTVAAIVISETAAVAATELPDRPDSPAAIVAASLADLRRRLPELPIGWLGHRADQIEPAINWGSLAAPLRQR